MPIVRKLKGGLTNLKGQKVGFLHVITKLSPLKNKKARWKVRCTAPDCGRELTVFHYVLIRKDPKTHCGCQLGGLPKKYPKEYHSWWDAKSRCHNPNHPSYPSYGAKGITMCDRWRDGFEFFIKDMGPAPKGYTLDRIDPHGHYELYKVTVGRTQLQCRWADDKTQARNKKYSKYVIDPSSGQPILAAELAERLKIPYQKLRGMMIEKGTWDALPSTYKKDNA